MKSLILTLSILACAFAQAAEPSNDFSNSNAQIKQLTQQELSYRLHVDGAVFVVSGDGQKLIDVANETREWQFSGKDTLESNWQFQSGDLPTIAFHHVWKIESDGRLTVVLRQYDSIERGGDGKAKYGKLLKEENLTIKNFAPIETVIDNGSRKVVVRLTPGVWPQAEALDLGTLPISGKRMVIYDQKGRVWADDVEGDDPSTYFGVVTHQGALFLSYVKFPGATLLGEVKGGRMKLKTGSGKVVLQSETPFVPNGVKANVYGIFRPGMKTDRLQSVRTYSSDKADALLRRLGE